MKQLVLVSQDLMFTSRTEGIARQLGMTFSTASNLGAVSSSHDDCQLIVVDLTFPGIDIEELVRQIRNSNSNVPIIACAPHVHEQRLEQARKAGCNLVVSRGQWDRAAERLCEDLLGNPTED